MFGELSFEEGALFGGGGAGLVLGAVSCGAAGAEFERAEFALDDRLAFERVVLFGGEELPAERGEFVADELKIQRFTVSGGSGGGLTPWR